jgi:transcriptional regulator with XRE-family HTH domain
MAVNKDRPYRNFGRWLALQRGLEKLTQAEAAEKMRALDPKGKGVSVETWSRWESGYRLPPRTKIDLVARVIKISPKGARRRAGYDAPERPIKRNRSDVIASMLKVLSRDMGVEAKILELYALGVAYPNEADPVKDRRLMTEIARAFDSLKRASKQVQVDAIERIRLVCREAQGGVQFTVPPDRATMLIPKQGFPPVMLGTRIEIWYRDSEGYEVSDEYVVRRIKQRKNRTLARIVCLAHTDFMPEQ